MWFICFFKQKTAYEMRISDWSSDVCSSDLPERPSSQVSWPEGTCAIDHPCKFGRSSIKVAAAERSTRPSAHPSGQSAPSQLQQRYAVSGRRGPFFLPRLPIPVLAPGEGLHASFVLQ